MFQFLKPVKNLSLIAAAYVVAGVTVEVLLPKQMGQVVDIIGSLKYSADQASEGFISWLFSPAAAGIPLAVLIVVGLVSLGAYVGYLRQVATVRLSMMMVYHLREGIYNKLQHIGFAFHDTMSTGQLINRSLSDLNNIRTFLQTCVLTILEIVLIVGGFIILLMTYQPWVALIALIPLPFWTWYILRFSRIAQPVAKATMEAGDRNVQLITENIAGVHVIKAFATEKAEIAKYGENCDDFFTKIRQRTRLFANFNPVIRSIAIASQLGLTAVTGIMIINGKMSVGDFLVVNWAMGAILARLQQVAPINEQYQNAVVSARRLHEIFTAVPAVQEAADARPLPQGQGGISFRGVCFGYDASKPVLHDISFEVPAGKMVAIVGPTGSGKSTLVSLISRFYDCNKGEILIDGDDVRDVQLHSLRSQVTYVFQETFLFSDSVSNNISYGDPNATAGDIEVAARLAQAHEFIEELPLKYHTVLAERGASLSGGQRQRLAIARAILKNPRILILDDATAAVDSETEELIRRGMRFAMEGRTTFVIAHRLSTVQAADIVLVLGEGRITQMGTHKELMRQEGHYRQIAAMQLNGDSDTIAAASPSHMKRIHSPKTFAAAEQPPADTTISEEVVQ